MKLITILLVGLAAVIVLVVSDSGIFSRFPYFFIYVFAGYAVAIVTALYAYHQGATLVKDKAKLMINFLSILGGSTGFPLLMWNSLYVFPSQIAAIFISYLVQLACFYLIIYGAKGLIQWSEGINALEVETN